MRLIMNDLINWVQWSKPLALTGVDARVVELHVNCEKPTVIRLKHGKGKGEKLVFVGALQSGKTEMRLNVQGEAYLIPESDGEVWLYEPAGANKERHAPDQVSFTGPLNRAARNPEIERMMMVLESRLINQVRQRDEQWQRQIDQLQAEKAAGQKIDPNTGEVKDVVDGAGATGVGEESATGNDVGGATSGGETSADAGSGEGQGSDPSTEAGTVPEPVK